MLGNLEISFDQLTNLVLFSEIKDYNLGWKNHYFNIAPITDFAA